MNDINYCHKDVEVYDLGPKFPPPIPEEKMIIVQFLINIEELPESIMLMFLPSNVANELLKSKGIDFSFSKEAEKNIIPQETNILIVEDTPQVRSILRLSLTIGGFKVYEAASAQQALQVLERQVKVDLILLDIMMPGIDGITFCKFLKETPKYAEIPVIFCTAKSDKESVVETRKLGAIDYIVKPFTKDTIIKKITENLSKLRAK